MAVSSIMKRKLWHLGIDKALRNHYMTV